MKIILLILMSLIIAGCKDNGNETYILHKEENYKREHSDFSRGKSDLLYQKILMQNATYDEILLIFKGRDESILQNQLNALVPYTSDTRLVAVLEKIWLGEKTNYPDFSWDLLELPSSKVIISFVLYQSNTEKKNRYFEYIQNALQKGDSSAKFNASVSVGMLKLESEIHTLKKLVYENDMRVVTGAVIGLQIMGTENAKLALRDMESDKSLSEQKKSVIRDVMRRQMN